MKKYKSFLKSICMVMLTQAIGYFLIKIFIHDYHTLTSIMNFPFIKIFVLFYDSWYPFVFLCSFIVYIHDKDNYTKLIFSLMLAALLSHITFMIYPTIMIRPNIEVKNILDFILNITYKLDSPAINCLPSLHCLYCYMIMFYITRLKNLKTKHKIIINVYALLIVLSTVFVKQHIIEDVLVAIIYAVVIIPIVLKTNDKLKKILKFIF